MSDESWRQRTRMSRAEYEAARRNPESEWYEPEAPELTPERLQKILDALDALEAFKALVGQMRIAQQAYYRTREQASLIDAKRLEKQVDDHLEAIDGR